MSDSKLKPLKASWFGALALCAASILAPQHTQASSISIDAAHTPVITPSSDINIKGVWSSAVTNGIGHIDAGWTCGASIHVDCATPKSAYGVVFFTNPATHKTDYVLDTYYFVAANITSFGGYFAPYSGTLPNGFGSVMESTSAINVASFVEDLKTGASEPLPPGLEFNVSFPSCGTPTPEPATAALLFSGAGLIGFSLLSRRKRGA